MTDSSIRVGIDVFNGPEALAFLREFRAEYGSIGKERVALGVDTTAVKAAQAEVAGLAETVRGGNSNLNIKLAASGYQDVVTQLKAVDAAAREVQASGGKVNVAIAATGGGLTVDELRAVAAVAKDVTEKGRVVINLSAVGAEQVQAQVTAIEAAVAELRGQNIAFNIDTTGAQEARAAAQQEAEARKLAAAAAREEVTARREALALAREQAAADREDAAAQEARVNQLKSATTAAGGSIMGVPIRAAAPLALAAGAIEVGRETSRQDTTFSQMQGNTTLSNADTATLRQSSVALASVSPAQLDDLANAFRHVTNEGVPAGEAIKVVTEANMSAISTGSKTSDVTNALAIVMHDFHLSVEEATGAMNVLHLAAAQGNVTLEEFSNSTAKVWADAGKLGVPLTDAAGAMSALTRAGYSAPQAATLLDGLMVKIVNITPSARKEIEALSKATGVDLVTDFTQAGLASRGLPGVLEDIQKATRGNTEEMLKFLPSLRGGRGEIALTTGAGINFRDVLDSLNDTMAGKTNPTLDAYQRAQGLASFQAGVFANQAKIAASTVGQELLPPMINLLKAVNDLNPEIKSGAIELGLAAVAIKTVSVGAEALAGWSAKLAASLAAEAAEGASVVASNTAIAASTAEATAATEAAVVATEQLAAARLAAAMGGGMGGFGGNAASAATVATSVEPEVESIALGGAASKIGTAVAGIGATLGEIMVPVTIGLVVGDIIEHQVTERIIAALITKPRVNANPDTKQADEFVQNVMGAPDPETANRLAKNYIDTLNEEIANYQKSKSDPGNQNIVSGNRFVQAAENTFPLLRPIVGAANAATGGDNKDQEIDAEIAKRQEQVKALAKANEDRQRGVADTTKNPFTDVTQPKPFGPVQLTDQEQADLIEHQSLLDQKRKELEAKGAPQRLIDLTTETGTGAGASKAEIAQAKVDLAEWSKIYDERLALDKQAIQDQLRLDKDAAKERSDAAIAESTKAETVLKAATTGTEGFDKKLDASQAIPSLQAGAEKLDQIKVTLDEIGQSSPHFDALVAMADAFRDLKDAEDKAAAAYNGYMVTLSQTDKRVQQVDTIRTQFIAALDAAETRQRRGTASSDDLALIAGADKFLGTLDQQKNSLQQHGATDWLGITKNLPDLEKADGLMRDLVNKEGGGQQVLLDVKSNADKAAKELSDLEKAQHETTLTIKSNAKEVQDQLDQAAKDRESHLKVHVEYDDPRANPYSNGGGGSGGDGYTNTGTSNGAVSPTTGTTGGQGYAVYRPLGTEAYNTLVEEGSAGKQSPFLDPAVREALMRAASQGNVDPRAILAYTRMENNNATNISAENLRYNNFGGIKYSEGVQGETMGGKSPEGDNYARFDTPADFFATIVADMSKGIYEGFAKSGDLLAARTRYVAGYAAPTDDQTKNIINTVAVYDDSVARFPGGEGVGGGAPVDSRFDRQDAEAKIAATTKEHLGDPKVLVQGAWLTAYGWCEAFVDNMVQQATGINKRFETADQHVRAAIAGDPNAGTVISAAEARPGDLVGWTSDQKYAGSAAGHIGVVSGPGRYIGTTAHGIQEETIGEGATYIRPPGGQPIDVRVVAATDGSGAGSPVDSRFASKTGGAPASSGTIDTSTGGTSRLDPVTVDISAISQQLHDLFGTMLPKDIIASRAALTDVLPILTQQHEATGGPGGKAVVTEREKQEADNAALQQGLQYELAFAQAQKDIASGSGDLKRDQEEITRILGGPLAGAVNHELDIMQQQANVAKTIADLTAQRVSEEEKVAARQLSRQEEDRRDAAAQLTIQRNNQDADVTRQAAITRDNRLLEDQAVRRTAQTQTEDRAIQDTAVRRAAQVQSEDRTIQDTAVRRAAQIEAEDRAIQDQGIARTALHQTEQRQIEDTRLAQSRQWEDEARNLAHYQLFLQQTHAEQNRALEDRRIGEAAAWTQESRDLEDRARYAQFYGSEQKRLLVDAQRDREDDLVKTKAAEDAQTQLQRGLARGATTEGGANAAALAGAAIADRQANERESFDAATKANQHLQDLEDRRQNQLMYDLQTESLAESRAHDDRVTALDDLGRATERYYQDIATQQAIEAQARTDAHNEILRQQADEDRLRSRALQDEQTALAAIALVRSRALQDEQTRLTATALVRSRALQDEQTALTATALVRSRGLQDEQTQIAATALLRSRSQQDEQTQITATRLAQARAHEDVMIGLRDRRQAEDNASKATIDSLNKQITLNQTVGKGLDDELKAAQAVVSQWQAFTAAAGKSGDIIASAFGTAAQYSRDIFNAAQSALTAAQAASQASYNQQTAGQYTANGVPLNQFPAPGQFRSYAVGSPFTPEGDALINEQGGEIRRLAGGETIIPADKSARLLDGLGQRAGGDVYHITLMASGNRETDAEMMAELRAWVEQRDRDRAMQAARQMTGGFAGTGRVR